MPEDLESRLKDKRKKLKRREKRSAEANKEIEGLKAEVDALDKVEGVIAHASAAYDQAYKDIKDATREIEIYYQRRKTIGALAKGKQEDIEKKKKETDSSIEERRKDEKAQSAKVARLEKEHKHAKEVFEKARDEYNSSIILKKRIEERLRDLKDLKRSVTKEEESNNMARVSFLLSEMNKILASVKADTKTKEKFKNELNEKWTAMDAAKTTLKVKEEQLTKARDLLVKKQRALETSESNRSKSILEKLA